MKKLLVLSTALLSGAICAAPLEAINLRAEAMNTICLRNNVSYVTTNHHAGVRNNTDQTQQIRVIYTICAKSCDGSHWYRVNIGPHGTWEDGFTLHLSPTYSTPGNYQIVAKTQVIGPYGLNQETSGYGNIQIN